MKALHVKTCPVAPTARDRGVTSGRWQLANEHRGILVLCRPASSLPSSATTTSINASLSECRPRATGSDTPLADVGHRERADRGLVHVPRVEDPLRSGVPLDLAELEPLRHHAPHRALAPVVHVVDAHHLREVRRAKLLPSDGHDGLHPVSFHAASDIT